MRYFAIIQRQGNIFHNSCERLSKLKVNTLKSAFCTRQKKMGVSCENDIAAAVNYFEEKKSKYKEKNRCYNNYCTIQLIKERLYRCSTNTAAMNYEGKIRRTSSC